VSEGIRLQKFLAERGVASRRHAAELVRSGRVLVNGKSVTEPGLRIEPGKDRVAVDGRPLSARPGPRRSIVLHKPRGYLCTASLREGKTVYDLLTGIGERLVPVGRLDKNSEGLLVMSNDGDLVHRLSHPRFLQKKTYRVTVSGTVDSGVLERLGASRVVDGYRTRAARVKLLRSGEKPGRSVLEFVLSEGRKRQVRRLCEAQGLRVRRLVRVRVGRLTLAGLQPGEWRDLSPEETVALKKAAPSPRAGC
jgi:23S rRNA pseudouridine2605 synthase